jgi:putative transposase
MNSVPDPGRMAQLMERLGTVNPTGNWMKQAAELIVEQMLAAEVDERLGRAPYQRRREDQQVGYRNGYKGRRLTTAEGRLDVALPQVRGTAQPYRSAVWAALGKRSPALEKLACEMYARGLSTRDIEELLGEIGGEPGGEPGDEPGDEDGASPQQQSLLSRSAVSRVTEALWAEYEAFTKRDLSAFDVVYLFCDAVYESLRQQAGCRSAILVTWAVCSDGSKVLLHMSLGNKESGDSWLEHFRSLVGRNLPTPITVTTDGAPGLIKAVEAMWPEAERIRCWFHKMKNVLEKVPADQHEPFKRLLQDVRDAPDHATGVRRANELIERHERELPSAMASFKEDLAATLNHLKLPGLHQRMIRTTNLCERSFVEERRRSKVIPHFFDERSCLKGGVRHPVACESALAWRAVHRDGKGAVGRVHPRASGDGQEGA